MDFKEYLREEERVDEILAHAAKFGQGVAWLGRGLVGGAKAAGGAVKQFMVDKAKKKAVKKAGEVAQNTLAPGEQQAEVTRMYITKAGVKFISETDVEAQHRAYEKQAAEILKRRGTDKPHPLDPGKHTDIRPAAKAHAKRTKPKP